MIDDLRVDETRPLSIHHSAVTQEETAQAMARHRILSDSVAPAACLPIDLARDDSAVDFSAIQATTGLSPQLAIRPHLVRDHLTTS